MKKVVLFIIIFLFLVWGFKKQIALSVVPLLINFSNPIADNIQIDWPDGQIINSTNKPNIILILADDLGFNDVSFYNGGGADGSLLTPNIDRLANDGVAFTNGYAASPVCSPSRAAIMTGRYSSRFGFEFTPYPKNSAFLMDILRKDDELSTIYLEMEASLKIL